MVVSLEIRTRIKRAERAPSSPKLLLKFSVEAPQFLSPVVEIEEVQASEVELESLAIMSGVGETHGHSEEEYFKRDFKDI